ASNGAWRKDRSVLLLAGELVALVEGHEVMAILALDVVSFVAIPICLNIVINIHAAAHLGYGLLDRRRGFSRYISSMSANSPGKGQNNCGDEDLCHGRQLLITERCLSTADRYRSRTPAISAKMPMTSLPVLEVVSMVGSSITLKATPFSDDSAKPFD